MKYFNIEALNRSITRIREGGVTHEHVTGTAGLGLARNYFPVDKFAITAEQIQVFTNKRPDLAIEKYITATKEFVPHCFIEFKSLISSSMPKIMDQLFDTLFVALDAHGNLSGSYSVFMIAIKGTKIAFYTYHSFASLLSENGIINYKGFIPLNYIIPKDNYLEYHAGYPSPENIYDAYKAKRDFTTNSLILNQLGALPTDNIVHPHVLDLLNDLHKEDIHKMFIFVQNQVADDMFGE